MYVSIRSIKIFGIWPHVRTYADRQTYTRVLQCSHASVGLAQARPNYGYRPLSMPIMDYLQATRLTSDISALRVTVQDQLCSLQVVRPVTG